MKTIIILFTVILSGCEQYYKATYKLRSCDVITAECKTSFFKTSETCKIMADAISSNGMYKAICEEN